MQNRTLAQICKKTVSNSSCSLASAPSVVAHPDLPKFSKLQDKFKKLPSLLPTRPNEMPRSPRVADIGYDRKQAVCLRCVTCLPVTNTSHFLVVLLLGKKIFNQTV